MAKKPIIGVQELKRVLTQEFPAKLIANLRREMEKRANDLVNDLKIRAPVYNGPMKQRTWNGRVYPIIPGALRDSIGWTWGKPPKGSFELGSGGDERLGLKITIYAGGGGASDAVFYHRWVEFGTATWGGSPFFYGTYRDHKRRIKGGISRTLGKTVKEMLK